jgi:cation diffusion facilitator family transporter
MPFPKDVPLPSHVLTYRQLRIRQLYKATLRAMGLRGLLIFIEFIGFWIFDSQALLVDGLASCVDLIFSCVLLVCLFFAMSPPDEEHPFGHGRIEPVYGLLMGAGLIQIGLYFFYNQLFYHDATLRTLDIRASLFALSSAIVMEMSYRFLKHFAKHYESSALLSEAMHYRADALNSLIAFVAVISASFSPYHGAVIDRIGAGLIALSMIYLGLKAFKENFDPLVDRRPSKVHFERIQKATLKVKGVLDTEKIRVQHYGPDAHVDIDIEVNPDLSIEQAHFISQLVRRSIQSEWPAVQDVTVHIEPHYKDDLH